MNYQGERCRYCGEPESRIGMLNDTGACDRCADQRAEAEYISWMDEQERQHDEQQEAYERARAEQYEDVAP